MRLKRNLAIALSILTPVLYSSTNSNYLSRTYEERTKRGMEMRELYRKADLIPARIQLVTPLKRTTYC